MGVQLEDSTRSGAFEQLERVECPSLNFVVFTDKYMPGTFTTPDKKLKNGNGPLFSPPELLQHNHYGRVVIKVERTFPFRLKRALQLKKSWSGSYY